MGKYGSTGSTGGRADTRRSTAVWRYHQRQEPSYIRCAVCGDRCEYRVRRHDGSIDTLCIAHFAEITTYPEGYIITLPTTGKRGQTGINTPTDADADGGSDAGSDAATGAATDGSQEAH